MAFTALEPHQPSKIILGWFIISSILVIWDTGFIFARPHSFPGGKLFWIWAPYSAYSRVDLIYSRSAWESGLGFTAAQASLNVVETILNGIYLYIVLRDKRPAYVAFAPLIGLIAVVMTESKTVLYWLQDILGGWSYTGHNSVSDLILLYMIPNGFWLVLPLYIAVVFSYEIALYLQYAVGAGGPTPKGPAGATRSRARSKTRKVMDAIATENAATATNVSSTPKTVKKRASTKSLKAETESSTEDSTTRKTPKRRKSVKKLDV